MALSIVRRSKGLKGLMKNPGSEYPMVCSDEIASLRSQ